MGGVLNNGARVASWGTKSITGTARASSSLHQLAVWPPRTATRGNRWGDAHVRSAGGPEGASEAGVSGRFLPFLAVLWPLRARNGQKRPETACRRSVAARPPRPCLGAMGYQLTLLGSLEKRRNESKLLDQQPRELLQVVCGKMVLSIKTPFILDYSRSEIDSRLRISP